MTDIKQRLTECINKVRKTKIVEKVKKKKKNKLSSSNCINGVFTYKSKANIDFETLCQKRLPGFTGAGISGGSTFADLQGSVERGGEGSGGWGVGRRSRTIGIASLALRETKYLGASASRRVTVLV